jgi:uncharacterized protein (TIRG00374 family)
MKNFRKLRTLIGFAISGVLLFMVLKKINFAETLTALQLANYRLVVWATCATLIINTLRSLRWRYLTENHQLVPARFFMKAFFVGFLANSLLPARLGEIVRAKSLGNLSKTIIKTGGTKTLSSILLERVFDGLILLFFFVVLALILPFPTWTQRAAWIAGLIFIGLMCFIVSVLIYREVIRKFLRRLMFWASEDTKIRALNMFNWFTEGLAIIKNRQNMIPFFLASTLIWLAEGLIIYIFIKSLNIDAPFFAGYFVMVLIGFGIAIPSAPGYVGVYQFVCIEALSIWGISESISLSFAVVMQAATFIPMNLIALGILSFSHMPLKSQLISEEN